MTLVAWSIEGPTALRQANVSFPSDNGVPRRSLASAPGTACCRETSAGEWRRSIRSFTGVNGLVDLSLYFPPVADLLQRSHATPLPRLVLASRSPRRAELLVAAGLRFDIVPVEVDETRRSAEPAHVYVARLALAKADRAREQAEGRLILGADTTVVIDGQVLGKPADALEAASMLGRLSGRTHEVLTGVALVNGTWNSARVETTRVTFLELTAAEIDWYVATGEPMDKAGAYAVQGLASRFVTSIEGSYSNVVGLPIAAVYALLRSTGGG